MYRDTDLFPSKKRVKNPREADYFTTPAPASDTAGKLQDGIESSYTAR